MLSKKVPLLETKISNLEQINSNLTTSDSIKSEKILLYKEALRRKEEDVSKLEGKLSTSKKVAGSSILISLILAMVCVLR